MFCITPIARFFDKWIKIRKYVLNFYSILKINFERKFSRILILWDNKADNFDKIFATNYEIESKVELLLSSDFRMFGLMLSIKPLKHNQNIVKFQMHVN
jgi:hypothetical protein